MKKNATLKTGHSLPLCFSLFLIGFLLLISKPSGAFAKYNLSQFEYSVIVSGKFSLTGTLPVVLTPLKGNYANGVIHLCWKSLQESNSSHFEIERSDDGTNFTRIGKVIAKGMSDKEVDYTYNDITLVGGVNYYRLKLMDKDGEFQYSNISAIQVKVKGIEVKGIYPGPFTDKLNITVSSEQITHAFISITDNTGKQVISRQPVLNKGLNNLVIENLSNLPKGFYLIKIRAGEMTVTKKIIK